MQISVNLTRKKLILLVLFTVAIVTTVVLAAGMAQLELLPGRPFPLAGLLEAFSGQDFVAPQIKLPFNLLRVMIACLWILLIVSVIGFIVSSEIRREVFRRVIIYSLWILAIYAVMVYLRPVISQLAQPEETPAQGLVAEDTEVGELLPDPPDFIVNPPRWFVIGITTLLIALFLGLTWLSWYVLIRRDEPPPSSLELITQEAQQALDDLKAGHNLKDTIMRCYADMSHVLAEQRNLHRRQGMTPREFERYLIESGLKGEDIRRLTRLFEAVRYGAKTPDSKQEDEAIACLTAIVYTYGQPA